MRKKNGKKIGKKILHLPTCQPRWDGTRARYTRVGFCQCHDPNERIRFYRDQLEQLAIALALLQKDLERAIEFEEARW